jgi:hypothetical protein
LSLCSSRERRSATIFFGNIAHFIAHSTEWPERQELWYVNRHGGNCLTKALAPNDSARTVPVASKVYTVQILGMFAFVP